MGAGAKRPSLLLQEELARRAGAAADEDVVESVAVDVGNGERRPLARRHVGEERLDAVVPELRSLVDVRQAAGESRGANTGSAAGGGRRSP